VKVIWADRAWEDYLHWHRTDPNLFVRINALIEECRRTPFTGAGKPEPLRENLKGWGRAVSPSATGWSIVSVAKRQIRRWRLCSGGSTIEGPPHRLTPQPLAVIHPAFPPPSPLAGAKSYDG